MELLYPELESWDRKSVVSKVWGYEVWFFNTETLCMKLLVIYPGYACSNHYHKKKYEVFTCTDSGPQNQLIITVNGVDRYLQRGDHVIIEPGMHHTFRVEGTKAAAFLEFSTHHREDDSYRLSVSHKFAGGETMDFLGKVGEMKGKAVLCVGDIALDEYAIGTASRLSPEAPVPVLLNPEHHAQPGCVGNVAMNVVALGGKAEVVSLVGGDVAGQRLLDGLDNQTIGTFFIAKILGRRTSYKLRLMAGNHHIMRMDEEDTDDVRGNEEQIIIDNFKAALEQSKPDVVYMADYDKGVLSSAVIKKVIQTCSAKKIPTIADPKLRHFGDFGGVTYLKPNDVRAGQALDMPVETETDIQNVADAIINKLGCFFVIMTRGGKGMYFRRRCEKTGKHIPARYAEVSELSGAGDTAGAALALGVAAGFEAEDAAAIANAAASVVVQRSGTAFCTPTELAEALNQ